MGLLTSLINLTYQVLFNLEYIFLVEKTKKNMILCRRKTMDPL